MVNCKPPYTRSWRYYNYTYDELFVIGKLSVVDKNRRYGHSLTKAGQREFSNFEISNVCPKVIKNI